MRIAAIIGACVLTAVSNRAAAQSTAPSSAAPVASEAPSRDPELPTNAFVGFYATGAVLAALGSGLVVYSSLQLDDAFRRRSALDEATHGAAIGAEALLALVGVGFVVLGAYTHGRQSRATRHGTHTVGATVWPLASGGAFGAVVFEL